MAQNPPNPCFNIVSISAFGGVLYQYSDSIHAGNGKSQIWLSAK